MVKISGTVEVVMTGGTIGSISSKNGITPGDSKSILEKLLRNLNIPTKNITIGITELMNKDSSNMTRSDQLAIAKTVSELIKKDNLGVVITHGTDTLHYTSAALTYILGDIEKPVVLTGSMRTTEHPNTDAYDNFSNAVTYAILGKPGVSVVFHGNVMEGVWTYEAIPGKLDGFRCVTGNLATVVDKKLITVKNSPIIFNRNSLVDRLNINSKVLGIEIYPGIAKSIIKNVDTDGLLLISPNMALPEHLLDLVKKIARDMPTVLTASHCNVIPPYKNKYKAQMDSEHTGVLIGTGVKSTDLENLKFCCELHRGDNKKIRKEFYHNINSITNDQVKNQELVCILRT